MQNGGIIIMFEKTLLCTDMYIGDPLDKELIAGFN